VDEANGTHGQGDSMDARQGDEMDKKADEDRYEERHKRVMQELQREWEDGYRVHGLYKKNPEGMRSSQLSALVMYLVRRGVI